LTWERPSASGEGEKGVETCVNICAAEESRPISEEEDDVPIGTDELAVLPHGVDLVKGEVVLKVVGYRWVSMSKVLRRVASREKTNGVQVARAERSSVLQDLVQTLLDRGEFIGLFESSRDGRISSERRQVGEGKAEERTIGISSSETGSEEDISL
jgi:hypothetical protein